MLTGYLFLRTCHSVMLTMHLSLLTTHRTMLTAAINHWTIVFRLLNNSALKVSGLRKTREAEA